MSATKAPMESDSSTPWRVVNEDRRFFLLPFMNRRASRRVSHPSSENQNFLNSARLILQDGQRQPVVIPRADIADLGLRLL